VVGGFVVTDRMLEMFKSKPGERPATSKAKRAQVAPGQSSQAAQAVETGDGAGPADDGGAA
jgi:hypothetical protein